jgi:hypothetical protein
MELQTDQALRQMPPAFAGLSLLLENAVPFGHPQRLALPNSLGQRVARQLKLGAA